MNTFLDTPEKRFTAWTGFRRASRESSVASRNRRAITTSPDLCVTLRRIRAWAAMGKYGLVCIEVTVPSGAVGYVVIAGSNQCRFRGKADMGYCTAHVCFWGNSGQARMPWNFTPACWHCHRIRPHRYGEQHRRKPLPFWGCERLFRK